MSENWTLEDFETAHVAEAATDEHGGKLLVVRGKTGGGEVKLVPVDYLALPEYWRIDVMSDSSESSPRAFEISLKLDGICGSKGVEVFGRKTSVKIDIN